MKISKGLIVLLFALCIVGCTPREDKVVYTQQVDIPLKGTQFVSLLLPNNLTIINSDYNNFWVFDSISIFKSNERDYLGSEVMSGIYYNKAFNRLSLNMVDATIQIYLSNADDMLTYTKCLYDCVVREKITDLEAITKLYGYPAYDADLEDNPLINKTFMQMNNTDIYINDQSFIESWSIHTDDYSNDHLCTIATCNSSIPVQYYVNDDIFILVCDKCVIGSCYAADQYTCVFASIDYAGYVFKMLDKQDRRSFD